MAWFLVFTAWADEDAEVDPSVTLDDDSAASDGNGWERGKLLLSISRRCWRRKAIASTTRPSPPTSSRRSKGAGRHQGNGQDHPPVNLGLGGQRCGGAHHRRTLPKLANVLLMMYSLSLDVGSPRFKRYRNWLLAAAVKNANRGRSQYFTVFAAEVGDPRRRRSTRGIQPEVGSERPHHQFPRSQQTGGVRTPTMTPNEEVQRLHGRATAEPAKGELPDELGPGTPQQKKPALQKVMAAYRPASRWPMKKRAASPATAGTASSDAQWVAFADRQP